MSKRENHRHLIASTIASLRIAIRARPTAVLIWLVLVVSFTFGFYRRGAPNTIAIATGFGVVVFLGFVCVPVARRYKFSQATRRALLSPGPEAMLDALKPIAAKVGRVPDWDALYAHEKAIVYAIYGHETDAVAALAAIDWLRRPPLVRAIGLCAEGLIDLLCGVDAARALASFREARALASANKPSGAAACRKYLDTCIAIAEAVLGNESASDRKLLQKWANHPRYPINQLLASFALASSPDAAAAETARMFLRENGPHCAALQAGFTPVERGIEALRPVSNAAAMSVGVPGADPALRHSIFRAVARVVGTWLLFVVAFLSIYVFFNG